MRPQGAARLPAAERRFILTSYGVPNWSGQNGELDHRVPLSFGGTTERANIWPEVGSIPNTKDKLEFYVHDWVCHDGTMRLRTARAILPGRLGRCIPAVPPRLTIVQMEQ